MTRVIESADQHHLVDQLFTAAALRGASGDALAMEQASPVRSLYRRVA
jgi:hypothetical protein